MQPFIVIQREIEQFLLNRADDIAQWHAFHKDPSNNQQPTCSRPPTVRNFTVVPLCDFHLKHIRIDLTDCYWLTSKCKAIPKHINENTGRLNKTPCEYYTSKKLPDEVKAQRAAELFNILFDMDKIQRNGKRAKRFYGQIVTDGVAASVIYERQRHRPTFFCSLMIFIKWWMGLFTNVVGIDPGDKTWLAGVRRVIRTGVEVSSVNEYLLIGSFEYVSMSLCYFILSQTNFKISPQQYHQGTGQKRRERKIAEMSERFTAATVQNLPNYPRVPSPRGVSWRDYIDEQMYLLPAGIEAFATRKYGRHLLDKYIRSNREADATAKKITQNQPSLIMLGAAELNPNRPIGIKGRKRCPGVRKLVNSIKKLGHSAVIFVDEYFTSQTCANCFGRFDRNTRKNRFKVCKKCKPANAGIVNTWLPTAWLPSKIFTQLGARALKKARQVLKIYYGNDIDQVICQQGRLVSKVASCRKNWQPIALNGELEGKTVVWHRDIVAARCILYKGTSNYLFTFYID